MLVRKISLILQERTILHSSTFGLFGGYYFTNVLNDERIPFDGFQSLHTPATAVARAENAELELTCKANDESPVKVTFQSASYLRASLNDPVGALGTATTPTVAFVDGSSN